jgi:hypothetical protein
MLRALAGDWAALVPFLRDRDQLNVLEWLHTELRPEVRTTPQVTSSPRVLRRALEELIASLERFDRRWREYLQSLDLGPVNALREGYNRHYVLEKECVVRSPRLARQGFQPLPALTLADLVTLLPPLPVPALR